LGGFGFGVQFQGTTESAFRLGKILSLRFTFRQADPGIEIFRVVFGTCPILRDSFLQMPIESF
jgi:hypothetical protein